MRVKLVFDDWTDSKFKSIYNTDRGLYLSAGVFHSGSTFDAIITLEENQHKELESALEGGCVPFFYIRLP